MEADVLKGSDVGDGEHVVLSNLVVSPAKNLGMPRSAGTAAGQIGTALPNRSRVGSQATFGSFIELAKVDMGIKDEWMEQKQRLRRWLSRTNIMDGKSVQVAKVDGQSD
uniref:Uncharacterized protein n=1 Tax=Melanopsichium pennsylvanicum 4 TaxID=1398559 RepID=A0A077QYU7_9BASI|nr:uncharacterized protein BN887_06049 [Melanopsichium pennsylvanicum 4]